MHRIIVVGGGAGGLELVTRLGDRYGRRRRHPRACVTLVDRNATHMWKPLLHEVAAGSVDPYTHQLGYAEQAYWHGFEFQRGELTGLNRATRTITLGALFDDEGIEILPARTLEYDTLVISIGSTTHFFGVEGAQQHAFALDTVDDADRFRRKLIAVCTRTHASQNLGDRPSVQVAIVGGGATGVELAAELRNTAHVLAAYGLHRLDPVRDIGITIVEAGPRILLPLPEHVAESAARLLCDSAITVCVGERVIEVTSDALRTTSGKIISADLSVWAAGIKAPPVLATLGGLPVGKLGQLKVRPTLQSEADDAVFALGDCAECPWLNTSMRVPPRAQAAHQQASFLLRALGMRINGHEHLPLPEFHYRDLGSLVSLGQVSAVGTLAIGLFGGRLFIQGVLARLMYASLYRLHVSALHGWARMALDTLAHRLRRWTAPRVKLH